MKLTNWLISHKTPFPKGETLPLSRFISSHWKGEKLIDKQTHEILKELVFIRKDIIGQLKNSTFSSSIQNALYQDYQNFSQNQAPLSQKDFWIEVQSPKAHQTKSFLDYYAKKTSYLFFLQQRGLLLLSEKRGLPIYDAYFSNLSTLNAKNFPLGSQRELKLSLFSSSLFKWYQPQSHLAPRLKRLGLLGISLPFDKIFTLFGQLFHLFFPLDGETEKNIFQDILLENLPPLSQISLEGDSSTLPHFFYSLFKEKKYLHFHTLHSHHFFDTYFLNLTSEQVFFNKFAQRKEIKDDLLKNFSLFLKDKNPLIKTIAPPISDALIYCSEKSQEKVHLDLIKKSTSHPHVFLLTSKPFFQPSLREKNKQVFNLYKLHKHFSLKDIKGLPSSLQHIYELKKKSSLPLPSTYFYFQFRGFFESAQDILKLYQNFKQASSEKIPIVFVRKNETDSLSLHFLQDTFVDGILMSTRGREQLTHPHFFQGIAQNCISLENLFKVRPIKKNQPQESIPLFPQSSTLPPFVLVLEKIPHKFFSIQVHIIPGSSYLGFRKENGEVDCEYFSLYPKQHDLNISLLRLFFQSEIGKQVSDLCLGGNIRQKGRIKSLLIPKFFEYLESLPPNVLGGFSVLKKTPKELKLLSPQVLFAQIKKIEPLAQDLFKKYPLSILSLIHGFQENLKEILQKEGETSYTNFNQPQLITELSTLKTLPLLPKHPDAFVEVLGNAQSLALPVTSIKEKTQPQEKLFQFEFYNQENLLARIHTSKFLFSFLKFLFSQTINLPLDRVLKSLNLPKEEDLKFLLPFYTLDYEILGELNSKCTLWLEQLLKSFIISDHD